MATKPAITVPTWATNTNYSVGPTDIPGTPTKVDYSTVVANGHIPAGDDGDPNPHPSTAQHMNDFQNRVAQTCQWVLAGSSTGEADAHIVETDSSGGTNLKTLSVDSTGTASVASMFVTQPPTRKGISITGDTTSVIIAQDTVAMEAGGACNGYAAYVTGDHSPYIMGTQSTAPTTFANTEVPTFAVRGTFSGNTSTVIGTAIESTKEYVPTFANQHVRALGYTNNHTATTSETTAVASTSWPNRKVLQASTSIFATVTFTYNTVSAPMTLTMRLKKGASTVDTSQFSMGNTADSVAGSHVVRVLIPTEPSGSTGGYSVTAQTSAGTVDLYNIMLTLESST